MLVCPSCRSENREEAQFCTRCGRSLSPEEASLVSRARPADVEPEIDIPAPKPRSALPGILTLAGIALVAIGVLAWFALRPNPCEGKFTSEQYPYCVALPVGWQGFEVSVAGTTVDSFAPPAEGPRVVVHATQLPEGVDTHAYTDYLRSQVEAAGSTPSQPQAFEVAGSEALVWDVSATNETTGAPLSERRITLVRDGIGWRIEISGNRQDVERELRTFSGMLESWAWK